MARRRPRGREEVAASDRESAGHRALGATGIDHEELAAVLDTIRVAADEVEEEPDGDPPPRALVSELRVGLRDRVTKLEETTGLKRVLHLARAGRLGPRGLWRSRHGLGELGTFEQQTGGEVGVEADVDVRLKAGLAGLEADASASLDVAGRARTGGELESVVGDADYRADVEVAAQAEAGASASLDERGLAAEGEVGGTAEAKLAAEAGLDIGLVQARGEVVAEASAFAEADGALEAGPLGLRAKLEGRIGAVARAEARGAFETLGVYLGGEKLDLRGEGTVAVEAGAYAEGVVRADATVIPPRALLEAKGRAFAGVRAEAIGEIGLGEFVTAKGHAGAWAGAGAEGIARLGYDEGKIRVSLAGGAAVSYGAGIGGTAEVDVAKIASASVGAGRMVASAPLRYASDPRELRRDAHETFGDFFGVASTAQEVARLTARRGRSLAGRLSRLRRDDERSAAERAVLDHARSLDEAAARLDGVLERVLAPEADSGKRRARSADRARKLVAKAEALLADERAQEAMELLAELLDEDRANRPALVALAKLAMHLGRYEQAEEALEHTLAEEEEQPDALVLLGLLEEGRGEGSRSEELFRRAVEVAPEAYLPRFNLGRLLAASGRSDEAVGELEEVARAHPDAPDAHSVLGIAHRQRGARADSMRAFAQAVHADPLDLDAYLTMADSLSDSGRLSEATELLHQARRVLPDAGPVYDKLAAVLLKRGEVEQALEALDEQVRVDAGDEEAHVGRATVALGNGSHERAAAAVEALLEEHPASWRGLHLRSILFDLGGRTELAVDDLRRASELAPREWRPLNDLGHLVCARSVEADDDGMAAEAIGILERAAALAPVDEVAPRVNLMLACARSGRAADARAIAAELRGIEGLPGELAEKVRAVEEVLADG